MIAFFAVAAARRTVLMGTAPRLQQRRIVQRRSSADLSIGYLITLLPRISASVSDSTGASCDPLGNRPPDRADAHP